MVYRVPLRTGLAMTALTLSLVVAPRVGAQTTVYSTFGPGDTYNTAFTWSVAEVMPGASPFQPSGFSYWLASGFAYGGPDGGKLANVRVAATKAKGALPFTSGRAAVDLLKGIDLQTANLIESWTLETETNDVVSIFSLTSASQYEFISGVQYWVRMRPVDENTLWGWAPNSVGVQGLTTSIDRGATWFPPGSEAAGTFDVTIGPRMVVSEPKGAIVLGGVVFIAWFGAQRRRSAVVQR